MLFQRRILALIVAVGIVSISTVFNREIIAACTQQCREVTVQATLKMAGQNGINQCFETDAFSCDRCCEGKFGVVDGWCLDPSKPTQCQVIAFNYHERFPNCTLLCPVVPTSPSIWYMAQSLDTPGWVAYTQLGTCPAVVGSN
jgi:hypothetical protein